MAENNERCCICLDKLKSVVELSCKHKFCYLCIKGVDMSGGDCPLCRAPIDIDLDKLTTDTILVHNVVTRYPVVRWLYKSRDGMNWWYYDEDTNIVIEDAYNKGESGCVIYINSDEYKIDFKLMTQMIEKYGREYIRDIMRREINSEEEKIEFDKQVKGEYGIRYSKPIPIPKGE